MNDEASYEFMRKVAAETLGEENVKLTTPAMYSEDFSMYLEKIPGAFLMIGVGNSTPPYSCAGCDLHSPCLVINEDVLPIGAALHSSLALSYLQLSAADVNKVSIA